MDEGIRVSVVTVTKNCAPSLARTLDSVAAQDYGNIEHVIIDGKSTDGTWEEIRRREDALRARLGGRLLTLSEEDGGISDAFNKGVARSTGDIVLLLNAGDTFASSSSARTAAADFERAGRPGVLYYRVQVGRSSLMPGGDDDREIWESCQVPHQGAFVSRETYRRIGGYDTALKLRMDFDFFARCRAGGVTHRFIPKTIARYETGGASMQLPNARRFYEEGLSVMRRHGLPVTLADRAQPLVPNCVRRLVRLFIKR